VQGDPQRLRQVLTNLVDNAADASQPGAQVTVRAIAADSRVAIEVEDHGRGIDALDLPRIFEPFFTTKESGKGSGLGLATVYGIVKQSGGHIWVYSELSHGTTFKIYLPSAEHKLGLGAEPQAEPLPVRREGVTLLLAEDDAIMRKLTRKLLEEHGYKVLEAIDGEAALHVISQNSTRIDLILTDVVMRGMNGPELVLRLMDSHPEMKVVYMSGYTGELVAHQGLQSGIPLLEKPFTRATLLKTIDTALGDAG
jgi:CheY-like chemotaxis protein